MAHKPVARIQHSFIWTRHALYSQNQWITHKMRLKIWPIFREFWKISLKTPEQCFFNRIFMSVLKKCHKFQLFSLGIWGSIEKKNKLISTWSQHSTHFSRQKKTSNVRRSAYHIFIARAKLSASYSWPCSWKKCQVFDTIHALQEKRKGQLGGNTVIRSNLLQLKLLPTLPYQ